MFNKLKQFLFHDNRLEELTKNLKEMENATNQMRSILAKQELQIKELTEMNETLLSEKKIDKKLIDDLMRESMETTSQKKLKRNNIRTKCVGLEQ